MRQSRMFHGTVVPWKFYDTKLPKPLKNKPFGTRRSTPRCGTRKVCFADVLPVLWPRPARETFAPSGDGARASPALPPPTYAPSSLAPPAPPGRAPPSPYGRGCRAPAPRPLRGRSLILIASMFFQFFKILSAPCPRS